MASVRAVVATLGKIDGDGDVTVPGFFGRQDVAVVPVHDWSHVPIGKGPAVRAGRPGGGGPQGEPSHPQARAWWEAFKFDLEHPPALQQWSYGFTLKVGGSFEGKFGGRPVRFLTPLRDGSPGVDVHEVGPVMLGAGVDTTTLAAEVGEDPGPDPDLAREYERFVRSTLEAA